MYNNNREGEESGLDFWTSLLAIPSWDNSGQLASMLLSYLPSLARACYDYNPIHYRIGGHRSASTIVTRNAPRDPSSPGWGGVH
jgi:hypothetical protein